MVSALDVAAFILQEQGAMTAMKLQKLVYYSQAWSLVWDESPLYSERIEAWANGPVIRELFDRHKGTFSMSPGDIPGDPEKLNETQQETVRAVLDFYGDKPSQWLSDLTHMEDPWKDARRGIGAGVRSDRVITHAAMAEYYSSIPPE